VYNKSNVLYDREFEIAADYHTFYIQGEGAQDHYEEMWNISSVNQLFAVQPQTIGVCTIRDNPVPVRVIVLEKEPETPDFEDWDYVLETVMATPSETLIVFGPFDYLPEVIRVPLKQKGTYKVRLYYGNLGTVSEDGLDGEDHYQVVLWPFQGGGQEMLPHIIKKRVMKQ
jgi:hypothetical protein